MNCMGWVKQAFYDHIRVAMFLGAMPSSGKQTDPHLRNMRREPDANLGLAGDERESLRKNTSHS